MNREKELDLKVDKNLYLLKKNIKFLRKKANLMTLDDLSEKSGISRDALFKIESVPDRYPNIKTVLKLAHFYGVGIGDLVDRDMDYEEMKKLAEEEHEGD